MAPEPMSEEMKEDIRRMTETLTNQPTIELLTRAGNQAKYNRWDLKERKKAQEEAMARAENNGDAGDYEEDVTRDTEASVTDTTGINEANVTDAGANETNATDVSEAKGKVTAKVKDVVSRVTKAMNRLSMTKKGAGDKTADDKGKSGHSSKQGGNKA
ncbi:Hypothetical protein NCS54_00432700 [Fusarium falciforme]|uniref:Hypothetical protein n=1 Tax=Fusarium falciforme TaxID=195108 RepID=UPI0023004573|nr:Hypothetical protein NCS54_00432700 [Fusarium falciforme]WAO87033.1 Hypothetical protein NCS54_00432700 [Fusarium falciforme]